MIIKNNTKSLDLSKIHIMGILNVTPDSFSDGGKYNSLDKAFLQAQNMINSGVSIIDVGGESTRPGASKVSLSEELKRVLPIIKIIREYNSDIWISIDTSKPEVMRQAIEMGADMINDVCAMQVPGALEIAKTFQVPVCLIHTKDKYIQQTNSQDISREIISFFIKRIKACEIAGIKKNKLILDPGFGFNKTLKNNYQVLAHLEKFHQLGFPILVGISRKSMLFKLLNKKPENCVLASVICATIAAFKRTNIIRVHDFRETLEAMKIIKMIRANSNFE
ncbi:dihydropteroate synthase [Candidatus Photodesmus anomalopis]|uniref:Dihydropteroate synthase n=1 Tax=Candidatus Photodesmus katoptron Akat1 TaxID=1236703 RepID=S3EI31_9GAMM|nr:dihydropteroate synthase [Candidatus Photodesmus katoptron]EPE37828.1 dihydropteroate synthase [Candidatus Photodesmus katoptron Akat1]